MTMNEGEFFFWLWIGLCAIGVGAYAVEAVVKYRASKETEANEGNHEL